MAGSSLPEVATKLLNESLRVKKGETITVETWNTGLPLAREVVKQARRLGCIPVMVFEDEGIYSDGVKRSPKDVLGKMGKHEYGLLAATDVYVFIPGPPLGAYYKRITRQEYREATLYNDSWYQAAEKAKLRGVRLSFGYVGKDLAGYLGKSAGEVAKAQLRGMEADFKRIGAKGRKVSEKLRDGAWVTVITGSGELRFRLKGAGAVEDGIVDKNDIASGENVAYLPPGMAEKAVDRTSATGSVRLSPSLTRLGIAESLGLDFAHGRLAGWSSRKPAPIIDEVLKPIKEVDRVLNYITIGLNEKLGYGFGVDRFVAGSIGMSGWGFVGIVRNGTLKIDGSTVVAGGKLR